MLSRRIGRALRSATPALAAACVLAVGGAVAAAASAREAPPCDNGAPTTVSCVETTPAPTVTAPTTTVEEPPTTTVPTTTEPSDPATTTSTVPTATATTETAPDVMLTPLRTVDAPTPPPPTTETTTEDATPPAPGWTGTPWSAPQNGRPTLGGGPYVFPVAGAVSFSDTWGAARATTGWHHGIDIFAPLASPVVAVADGVLFSVGWNDVGGNRVWLRDRGGNFFYYAHLSAFAAIAVNGARVPAGTVIGFVGNTGDAEGTPYHLHFEIHPRSLLSLGYDGAVSPFPYLRAWQRKGGLLRGVVGRAVAPEPGAILIGYTDISSADGLSSAPLEQTLDRPLVAQAAVQDSQPVPAARAVTESIPPPGADDVRLARTLDTAAAQPEAQEPTVWDALAVCESGGGWSTNTGNGFVGGLQFLPQTWAANGGTFFAPSAHLATREQQILVAQRVLASQGWNAWPACSLALGLRGSDGR